MRGIAAITLPQLLCLAHHSLLDTTPAVSPGYEALHYPANRGAVNTIINPACFCSSPNSTPAISPEFPYRTIHYSTHTQQKQPHRAACGRDPAGWGARFKEMLQNRLAFTCLCALPLADKILRGECGHVVSLCLILQRNLIILKSANMAKELRARRFPSRSIL